jgi:quercetin dioxygenase-like cupin family protein
MAKLEIKSLSNPDEQRPFEDHKGGVDLLIFSQEQVGRGVFEPGWKWSEHVKPFAKTESCQAAHFGYVFSGRMKIVMNDGQEGEIGPGDVFIIPPGHDAWTVGHEPCEMIDFTGMKTYARTE